MHTVRGWRPAILHDGLCGSQRPKPFHQQPEIQEGRRRIEKAKQKAKDYDRDHHTEPHFIGYAYKVLELK